MKLSKKTILIGISTLVVAGAGLAYYFITKDNSAVLSWKDASWLYRKSIAVANSGSELINEEVLIEVDTATLVSNNKLQNTCADLRFTDSDDNTYLTYWVEGGCNTATTQVWIRIPSLPNGGKNIYMYYGNSTATSAEESWSGNFTLFSNASCSSGWTANTNFNNAFPYGSTTYGTTGGSASHSHTMSGNLSTTTIASKTIVTGDDQVAGPHYHSYSGSTATKTDTYPPYLQMIYCYKNKLDITNGQVSIFDSAPSAGWTRFSALDAKFPMGYATYGGTGGAATHTQTYSITSGGPSATVSKGWFLASAARATNNHTHLVSGTTVAGNSLPPYIDVLFYQRNSAGAGTANMISMVSAIPPLGWTRISAFDDLFIRGNSSYGGTGGTTSHDHTFSGTTGSQSATVNARTGSANYSQTSHTHTYSGTTGSGGNVPPYYSVIYAKRKASVTSSVGAELEKNLAPNSPTGLTAEGSTNPIGLTDFTPEFSAIFTDTNSIDSASYYQIEVNTASDFSGTSMWNTNQTALSPVIANGARSQDIQYSGSTLQEGITYYWRIKFWDDNISQGILSSNWSSTAQFTMNTTPNAPTNLFTEGVTNPTGITDFTPEFSAIFSDTDASDVGNYYQIEVNTASNFTGTIMWDSTQTELSPTIVNGARSQDITYNGSALQAGTIYYWRIRFWDNRGIPSILSSTAQFTINSAPNAPTNLLTEGATNPASLTNFSPKFSAIFSDADSSDVGSHYQIEVNTASDFSGTSMWDSTKTVLSPTIVNGNRSQDITYAGSALQEGVTYYWRIKFWDDKGTPGATTTAQFTMNIAPSAPTNLLTEEATNPNGITDFTPEFSAVFNDSNSSDVGSHYQIEVNTASNFTGTVMWDSTQTAFSPTVANGARSQDISYAGSTLQGGTTYYWRIKFWDNNGTQGALSSTAQFTMNALPNAPTGLLTEGATNPTNLTNFTPKFSAVFSDPNSSDVGTYYQIEISTVSDFTSSVIWDSTQTALTPALTNGARSQDITYAGPTLYPYITYYWRIRFWDDKGTPSATTTNQFSLVVSTWQNPNLQYKMPVIVANTTGSTLTNEDTLVQIDTATLIAAGKMQVDCDDMRFYDSDDSTSLQYWVEGKCNTSSTQIWVKVPSLPNGGKSIYMYYGDPATVNAAQAWSGNVIMFADTTCPTGWTRASDLDNRFLYGGTTYGTTGGGNSHTHSDAICTSSSISTTSIAGTIGGALTGTTITHTHTSLRATLLSAAVVPPYEGMIACYSNSFLFSQGLISMFNTSTPSGWTRYSELDNKFVEAKDTYGETGGTTTHTHSTTTGYTTGTTGDTQTVAPAFSATGGTITYTDSNGLNPRSTPPYAGGYTVHTFTTSGTFTISTPVTASVLVIGGGGGGGNTYGGGGGGGGVVYNASYAISTTPITVTRGAGGTYETSGGNSVFGTITAYGGGGGGSTNSCNQLVAPKSGGSGGGNGQTGAGASGTAGQGNAGGNGYGCSSPYSAGGGGGASSAGASGNAGAGGVGGTGYLSSISGVATYYGGGGGGNGYFVAGGSGGAGFGQTGGGWGANFWGGGGGGMTAGTVGYEGGNGGVIVRYPTPTAVNNGVIASSTHTHLSTSATPTTVSNLPPYLDMVFAKADSTQYVTGNNVVATSALPPLGWNRFTGLDSKFPRGATTYGATGGSTTHLHDVTVNTGVPSATVDGGGTGTNYADSTHTHSCTTASDASSNIPAYSTVIYAQRKTSQTTILHTELLGNYAPNAPTNLLTEGSTNPTEIDDTTPEFSAIYTDQDATDSAIAYQIQINTSSDFTGATVWDSTQTSMTTVDNGNRSQDITYAGPTLNTSFPYYWRIRFWDDNSLGSRYGAWSNPASFSIKTTTWGLFDSWYRYPVIAGNNTGSTLTNEDVLVQIDTATLISAGKMQADCDDIRFMDGDDATPLQYWVEGKCNTSSTQIWVKVPSLPNGGKTIFMYYGDSNATNTEEDWTGNVIMFADTTCPTGWTRAEDLDNKFLYGGTTYGTTGGGTSHTHSEAICTSSSINTTSIAGTSGGALGGSTTTHTHTSLRATLLSATVVPPYEGMIACYSNTFLFSQGLISMFNTNAPSGWTRESELDSKFVEAKDTYGETGGTATHTHSTTTGYTTGTASATQTLLNSFSATGGTVTTNGNYTIHTFTSSGTFTVVGSGTVEVFVVGGGITPTDTTGGAAGQVVYNSSYAVSTGNITVTVGGTAANSAFGSITATAGGGAAGGAGGNGGSSRNGKPGADGTISPIDGLYYGGGGGGGACCNNGSSGDLPGGPGGNRGGGYGGGVGYSGDPGGKWFGYNGGAATANTGGGGGAGGCGSDWGQAAGGAGGSGIVIIRRQTVVGASGSFASATHTHDSASTTPSTVSNLPPYLDVVFAKANTDQYVTGSNIIATNIIPPLGWSRFTALDNRFPRGATSYGTSGGATTHVHDTTVTTGTPSGTADGGGTGTNYADSTHTHSCTVTSDTGSNMPPYSTVIYTQRKTSQTTTIGIEQIGNITPDTPSDLLVEGLSNPLNVTDTTPEFSAIYTDGNVADIARYYQIQVNTTPDFTGTVMWDSTKTEYTPGVANGNRSQDVSYAGTSLNAGSTYYWRIKFWDDNSIGSKQSSWSTTSSFIMQAPPNTPTALQTNGMVNPIVLTHIPPSFTAFYSDANSDNATAYQIEVNTSPLFTGSVMWDSGKVATTVTSGQRSPEYSYDGIQLIDTKNTYYWHIKFWDTIDAPSEWSEVATFVDSSTHTYYEGLKLNGLKLN